MNQIPVIIVTGFLGVGKTTFLQRVLTHAPSARLALIVNEFGDVGIDGALLQEKAKNVVELPGGALCCAALGDTQQALVNLFAYAKEEIDLVIIETTGLADPLSLMRSFFHRPTLRAQFVLRGVLTLVDATNAVFQSTYPEWQSQVKQAQQIMVTKTDKTNGEVPEEVSHLIQSVHPGVSVVTDLDLLAFSFVAEVERFVEIAPDSHAHSIGLSSVFLTASKPLSREAINRFIAEQLVLHGDRLLRYKGIFWIEGEDHRFVFQGGGFEFEQVPDRLWGADERRESVLVIIGHEVRKEEFQAAFLGCQAND